MCSFGISFSGDFSGMIDVPKGFAPVRIIIGSASERAFSDQSIWPVEDYMEHWRLTAKRCVENKENAAFCLSLGTDNADLWVCVYGEETVKFYNVVAPASHLEITNRIVAEKTGQPDFTSNLSPAASCWDVPTAYLKCLADKA